MSRLVGFLILACVALPLSVVAFLEPNLINKNTFLAQVLTVELINILSVITTVTLGVAAILYARIGELIAVSQDRKKKEEDAVKLKKYSEMINLFESARTSVKRTSFILIFLLGTVFVLLFVKSLIPECYAILHALIGAVCFVIFAGNILSMIEIHQSIFRLPPAR